MLCGAVPPLSLLINGRSEIFASKRKKNSPAPIVARAPFSMCVYMHISVSVSLPYIFPSPHVSNASISIFLSTFVSMSLSLLDLSLFSLSLSLYLSAKCIRVCPVCTRVSTEYMRVCAPNPIYILRSIFFPTTHMRKLCVIHFLPTGRASANHTKSIKPNHN